MPIHKNTPQYLNKDSDERLVQGVEMTDALNIRMSADSSGDQSVIKNAYGTTAISLDTSLPAGTNKVIGSVSDEQRGFIFYFVWNSNNDHSIYRYSTGSNSSQRIIKDSVLEFSENGFVKGDVVINVNGDVLLYFNDGTTAPKKINVTKALINGYPQLLTGTDEEKLEVLTVAKKPPVAPPTYSLVNNPDIRENKIKEKVFQFAYKYIYDDGEHSALSPYSTLTVAAPQLKYSFSTPGQLEFFNEIEVYVKNSKADVDKIVVYAREGNEGAFYEIDEINNTGTSNPTTVRFSNDVLGSALPDDELNKLFDNVPQKADSQTVISGRLMYGGYTEGYENIDVDATIEANYHKTEESYNVVSTFDANGDMEFDWSDLPSTFSSAATLYVSMNYGAKYITLKDSSGNNLTVPNGNHISHVKRDGSDTRTIEVDFLRDGIKMRMGGIQIRKVIPIPAGSTRNDVIQLFKDNTQGNRVSTLLSPLPGTGSVTNINTNLTTIFTIESADWNGRADIEIDWVGTATMRLSFKEVQLYPNSFYVDGDKRDIVAYDAITLDYSSTSYGVQWTESGLSIGSFFASESVFGDRAFKSGSTHNLGIVYYDDRNRSSGVQELDAAYVNALNDRSLENGLDGRSSLVVRINHSAPLWAKRWAPVYAGKGNTELKLMYGVQGAFIPFRTSEALSSFSSANVIYVSLNQLFDRESSYVKGDGANISYAFEPGDKLRIVKYSDNETTRKEFEIVDFVTLAADDNNPILNEISEGSIASTTGSFLVVKENYDAEDFRISRIVKRTSAWFDKCIVEIVKNNPVSDSKIYYEIGKSYECTNGVHSDDRTATTTTLTVSVAGPGTVEARSSQKIFKGDVLVSGGTTVTVGNVYEDDGQYRFYGESSQVVVNGTYTITNTDKVVQLEHGDVYWKLRTLYVQTDQPADNQYIDWNRQNAVVEYIEDYSVSDFFDSKSTSIGRPIAYIPNAKTVHRKGSITYSDYDSEDSTRLNLSSFNLSRANWKDIAYEHGSVMYMVGYRDKLYILQQNRVAVAPLSRDIIQTTGGESLVAISTNVIGPETYYAGEYGVGTNPESVAHKEGMVYFTDVNAGKVLRVDSNQGLTVISAVGMSSYFEDKFRGLAKYGSHLIAGGFDDDNEHYVVHTGSVTASQAVINSGAYAYDVSLDSTGTQITAPVQYDPSAIFDFLSDPRAFDATCDTFDEGIEAVVYLDQLSSGAPVYTSLPYQKSNALGVATNSAGDFFVMIRLNMFIPAFIFDNNQCDGDASGAIDPNSTTTDSFTVSYDTISRKWATRYSFVPERIDSVHAEMYSFKGGKIYKHEEAADRNTFYGGSTEASIVEVISNPQPSAIKTYEAVSIEGNAAWSAVVTTTKQESSVAETSFSEKEGIHYAYIHGTTSTYGSTISSVSSTSEIFALGEVDSVSSSEVTFKNAVTGGFPFGTTANLYKVGSSTLESLSVTAASQRDYNKVVFSGAVTAVQGDILVIVADSAVEGDQIRDYYAKIKLSKTTSDPVELYAVNTVVTDSKAHH